MDKNCFTIISLKLISKLENQPADVFQKVVCLQHRWFPEDSTDFLRTAILKNICERLLRQRQLNYLLYGQSGELCRVGSGRSVGRQNNNNNPKLILKIKILIIELKKLVLLCQHKLHPHLFTRDSTKSSALNLFFSELHCILKDHIRRYVKSVLLLFWSSKI